MEFIARKSPGIARIWLDMCHLQNNSAIMNYTEESDVLSFLERSGFLISTETSDFVHVRMLGKQDSFGSTTFCVENHYE